MAAKYKLLPIDLVWPNPDQPRKEFDEESLASLAESIAQHGVRQPISVKVTHSEEADDYIIIDGERRWRASKMAGKTTIPAIVEDGLEDPDEEFKLALIGNLQRQDLNPAEEGNAYKKLRDKGFTLEGIAKLSGRSITTVTNALNIAELPEEIQGFFASGAIGVSYYTVTAIKSLPKDRMLDVTRQFVARRSTASTIIRTCKMINAGGALRHNKQGAKPAPILVDEKDIPAIAFTGENEAHLIRRHGMDGDVLPWLALIKATETACNVKCILRDSTSKGDCGGCPLLDVLRELSKEDDNPSAGSK